MTAVGEEREQAFHHRDGERESGHAAGSREQQALGEQLPEHAPAARADGEADGDLLLPRRGARRQQAGEVGAGDQQHQSDHAHQDPQRLLVLPPQVGVALRARA